VCATRSRSSATTSHHRRHADSRRDGAEGAWRARSVSLREACVLSSEGLRSYGEADLAGIVVTDTVPIDRFFCRKPENMIRS